MAQALKCQPGRALRPCSISSVASRSRVVRCKAQAEEPNLMSKMAIPVASMVAAAMVAGAALPLDAMAASKSGGRVGGSSFASRRAPARTEVRSTTINNYSVVTTPAPPVYAAGYGYGAFGGFSPFGGFRIMPTFVMPVPFFGGILQLFFLVMIVSVVFSVIRGFMSSSNKSNKKDGDWGDL